MPHVLVENVDVCLSGSKIFGREKVLSNISFALNDGDRLALIGPNGAGKSTLLMLLAGILHPSRGRMEVEGNVSALFNLNVGLKRQSSGRRNMILRNLISGRRMKEIKARLPAMIEFADVGDYINRPLEIYSQGMAMRTVFAAATEFKPEILLMDEWLGVGDQSFRNKSNERMKELTSSSGMIILATHRQNLSEDICNLGLYLKKGRVIFFGDIQSAWQTYLSDSEK